MPWTDTTNLKFCLLNAENLFLLFDKVPEGDLHQLSEAQWQRLSSSVYENKSLKKTFELASAIKSINADIVMLCEVGGFESLKNFNALFLGNQYSACLIEGNSERNIDVGFLVRKNLPFYFDLQSNKNRPINYLYPHERESLEKGYPIKGGKIKTSHKFSRDVAELRLFTNNREKPFLIILLVHLKSRLDPDHVDPNGFERRRAELKTLLEIFKESKLVHPNLPMIVAGDFNGNASSEDTEEEFKEIYSKTQLKDVLELGNIPKEDRATFYQVKSGGRVEGRQIDYCFLSPSLQKYLGEKPPYVYRYKDEKGATRPTPRSLDEKMQHPSDHYPIVFEVANLRKKR
jgi:hypothetical protein